MRATIDSAGRIVVPKPLRETLGFEAGQTLELTAVDGRLEVEIAPVALRLEPEGRGLIAVPAEPLPPLTAERVREILEQTRR